MHQLLRITLDLFGVNSPQAPVEPGLPVPKKRAKRGLADPALTPASVPTSVQEPDFFLVADGLASSEHAAALVPQFRHPQANRELRLGHTLVAYELKRSQRRTIGFSVGPDGLAVRAPRWVTLKEIDLALATKGTWILRKLQEMSERHRRLAQQQIEWCDGAILPFLGELVRLQLDPTHRFEGAGAELAAFEMPLGAPEPGHNGATPVKVLRLSLPLQASAAQIRDAVQAWLMRQAREVFQQRLNHFGPLLGVQWTRLSLSNAGTRWGSARVDGSIRLNWRLIHMRPSVIDYVVAHELSHLRVMDHSPRFWDTVRSVVPDFADLRAQLKSEPTPHWG